MRNVITHELLEYSWDIYFVSIGLWAQGHKLIVGTLCGHIELFGTGLYLGRAPRTKETARFS